MTEIPVIFYDGESEIDIGKVQITPFITTFKLLQSTLSDKIGISPNQITIYFDTNNTHHSRRSRRPVTSKFDFSVFTNCECFLCVVLKKGRRNRRRRNNYGNFDVAVNESDFDYFDYVNRIRMLELIEREKERYYNYLMSLNLNSNVYNELSGYNYNYNSNGNSIYSDEIGSSSCSSSSERVFCEVCFSFGSCGDTVPFHWCKNDVVTTGFRSRVGPIAPPSRHCG